MILFNTTYLVETSQVEAFIQTMRDDYLPLATASGHLSSPRLMKVLSEQEEGESYSLQFEVKTKLDLVQWYDLCGDALTRKLMAKLGSGVVGFSTLLEVVEL